MVSELITSTGTAGKIDSGRSAGRTYLTSNVRFTDAPSLQHVANEVSSAAFEHGRRRWVLRARCTQGVVEDIKTIGINPSVQLPFSELAMGGDSLITIDHNTHISEVAEWEEVYDYWKQEKPFIEPVEQINRLPQGFTLTNNFTHQDRETLRDLWKPFGWKADEIDMLTETYRDNPNLWVSGVRDENGKLASACMGEALVFDGVYMVEATEFGTRKDLRGKNLSTAAVVGLNAQIIQRAWYEEGIMPLIISEYDMTSRSDVVGRKAGMTIPGVEGVDGLTEPTQVLRKNAIVLDDCPPNDLIFGNLPAEYKEKYRDAFRNPHRYLRNFIVGMMTKSNIDKYYSQEKVAQIISRFSNN